MEEYLKKLDEYIDLKVQYMQIDMTPQQEVWLRQARGEMETALLLLIKNVSK